MDENDNSSNHYDLIILGTGIVESVVSCAASKCGKKVLHIDSNDYYGNDHCSIPFEQLVRESKELKENPASGSHSIADMSPISSLDDFSTSIKNCVPSYSNRNCNSSTVHPACIGYLMERRPDSDTDREREDDSSDSTAVHPAFCGHLTSKGISTLARALHPSNSRKYSVDKICQLVYCSGEAVNVMLEAGVDAYLEFNSLEYLYYYKAVAASTAATATAKPAAQTGGSCLHQWSVPCSKADIFSTTLLELVSKRSLMKFLQYTADWGRINVEGLADISSLNELQLGAGRSLNRPQNKQHTPAGAVGADSSSVSNGETNRRLRATSFVQFMREKPQSLPLDLRYMIYYALCMQSESLEDAERLSGSGSDLVALSAYDGLKLLYDHIMSLNKFGKTAFLYPLYGIGEVSQAFCRMSAVWGAMFMLRTDISDVVVTAHEDEGDANGAAVSVEGVVITVTDAEGGKYTCDNFVCHYNYWNKGLKYEDSTPQPCSPAVASTAPASCGVGPSTYLAYRTSVTADPILCPQTLGVAAVESRDNHAIGIISPYSVELELELELPHPTSGVAGNRLRVRYSHPYAVHIIQVVSKAQVVPDDSVLVYYATTINSLIPAREGQPALSLSRLEVDHVAKHLMNRVVAMMQESILPEPGSNSEQKGVIEANNQELFYVTTVKPTNNIARDTHPRVHICGGESRSQQSVDINHYFTEARELFLHLYPSDVFMKKPEDYGSGDADDSISTIDAQDVDEGLSGGCDAGVTPTEGSDQLGSECVVGDTTGVNVAADPECVPAPVAVSADDAPVEMAMAMLPDVEDEDLEFLLATLKSVS